MYDFLDILKQREQFHQCSDESGIREYLNGEETLRPRRRDRRRMEMRGARKQICGFFYHT